MKDTLSQCKIIPDLEFIEIEDTIGESILNEREPANTFPFIHDMLDMKRQLSPINGAAQN